MIRFGTGDQNLYWTTKYLFILLVKDVLSCILLEFKSKDEISNSAEIVWYIEFILGSLPMGLMGVDRILFV